MITSHISGNLARAIRHYRAGSQSRLAAGLAASRIVGQYTPGAAQVMARELGLSSVSQVENLATAGRVWRKCRRYWQDPAARHLSPSHYYAVGRWEDEPGLGNVIADAVAECPGLTAQELAGICALEFGETRRANPPQWKSLERRMWNELEHCDIDAARRDEVAALSRQVFRILRG